MKKRLILGLACTLMLGVGGCMNEKDNLSNESTEFSGEFKDEINNKEQKLITKLINNVNDKYREDFKAYKFIPSQKGFNTDASMNYIFARNSEGLEIYIAQRNDAEVNYVDTYIDEKYSTIVEQQLKNNMNFEGNVYTFVSLNNDPIVETVSSILNNAYETTVLVHVPFTINKETIEQLYEYYLKIYEYREKHIHFIFASGEFNENSREYMSQYLYYRNQASWGEFDTNIKQILNVKTYQKVTLNEFEAYLSEVN